jgi:predicted RNase H-like HicB family nuclease
MVEKVLVEVLHQESNFVILRVPGRAFPGVVIQGDSLAGLVDELSGAIENFESDREESLGCLQNAFGSLKRRLDDYNEICRQNGIQ